MKGRVIIDGKEREIDWLFDPESGGYQAHTLEGDLLKLPIDSSGAALPSLTIDRLSDGQPFHYEIRYKMPEMQWRQADPVTEGTTPEEIAARTPNPMLQELSWLSVSTEQIERLKAGIDQTGDKS